MSSHDLIPSCGLSVLLFLLTNLGAQATIIHVPADQSTIQAGVDAASESDTVLVAPGTYTGDGNKGIDFGGKNVVLKSEAGAEITIIDCEHSGRGFYLHSGEDSSAVIEGFTVRRGMVAVRGGGADLNGCSPTLKNCVFEDNKVYASISRYWWCSDVIENWCRWVYYVSVPGSGGAVACTDASPTCTNCQFTGNIAARGGAIYAGGSSSLFLCHTIINDNHAALFTYEPAPWPLENAPTGNGGGVYCSTNSTVSLDHCTIVGNRAYYYDALWEPANPPGYAVFSRGNATLSNCVVAFNGISSDPRQKVSIFGQNIILSRSNLFGNLGGDWISDIEDQANINGNFSLDPMFCDTANADYHLNAFSPCAPGVQPNLELIGALGIGCGTIICGDANGDGELTEADLQHVIDYYYGMNDIWPLPVSAGDMDCDGVITVADIVLLSGYIHGWGPTPCCVPPPPSKPPREENADRQLEDN